MGTRWRKTPYRFTRTLQVDGVFTGASNGTFGGTLGVTGASTLAAVTASGVATMQSDGDIAGKAIFRGNLISPYTSQATITTVGVIMALGTSAGTGKLASSVTVPPIGILAATVTSGGQAQVVWGGIQNVLAKGDGANIAIGDRLTFNTSGRAIKSQTDGDFLIGIAEAACTSDETTIRARIALGQRAAT